jgi:putative hydrolase of the HAD superfamily
MSEGNRQGLVKSGREYRNRFRTHPHPETAAPLVFAVIGDSAPCRHDGFDSFIRVLSLNIDRFRVGRVENHKAIGGGFSGAWFLSDIIVATTGPRRDMSIEGILFDIGDTLLPATKLQEAALAATSAQLHGEGLISDIKAFQAAYRQADQNPNLDASLNLNHLYSDSRIVTAALELLHRQPSGPFVERFLRIYRENVRAGLKPATELADVLSHLQQQGLRLGIASNGTGREQREQLELLGILAFFDPILISEELGFAKPDPRFFLLAADHWRLVPSGILVLGDRIDWEVLGALQAGMQSGLITQFVDHSHEIEESNRPTYIIEHIRELPELVRSHSGSGSLR